MSDINRSYKFYNRDTNVGVELSVDGKYIEVNSYEGEIAYIHRSLLQDVVECILKLNEEIEYQDE